MILKSFFQVLFIAFAMAKIFLFNSCVKKPEYVPLPQYMRDCIDFKEGSYWVFRDSVSGDIDTIRRIKYWYKKIPPQGSSYINDFFDFFDYSTYYNLNQHLVLLAGAEEYGYNQEIKQYNCLILDSDLSIPGSHPNIKNIKKYDTLTIQNKQYKNILEVKPNTVESSNWHATRVFWCPGVGIVKFKNKIGITWEIIDNKLIK